MRHVLFVMLIGCTSLDRNIDPGDIQIAQGIYGLTISACDTSPCSDEPAAHVAVHAHSQGVMTATTSADNGYFELGVPPGSYELCVTFSEGSAACTTIDTTASTRVRADWESGPGGGIWCYGDGHCGLQ